MNVATQARLNVVRLTPHIGAELRDIDLRETLDASTIEAIHQAWLDHAVVVFRNQELSQEDLLRVTGYFGELGKLARPPEFFPKGYSRLLPNIMMISNIRENGQTIGALPDGEMMFHHDMLHAEIPHNATLLYSMEVPTYGGDTLFASGYAAYESLDPAIRTKLAGRNAIHHYNYGSTQRGDDRGIVDMPQEESDPLLNAIFDHSERPEFVYTHSWRVGDLLVWDNRCSMHARTDFPSDQRRLMLRTTVKGTERPC